MTSGSGGIRTHASEETGALNQRLRPLGHATLLRAKLEHARLDNQQVCGVNFCSTDTDYSISILLFSVNWPTWAGMEMVAKSSYSPP